MACIGCTSGPCPQGKFAGECVYYSGSFISGPSIANGDNFNSVVNKLKNYITAQSIGFTVNSPLSLNTTTHVVSIQPANTSQSGYLTQANWNTFNGKENALTFSTGLNRSTNTISWNGVTGRKNGGSDVATRRKVNFIEGSNVTLTVADNSGADSIDVTIAATGSGGSGTVSQFNF